MAVSSETIKQLRESSGAGILDCKKALDETNGDLEAAVDWLRKKGISKAAKKSGRVAAEGIIALKSEGTKAVLVEVNSETDFVARNEQFQALAASLADLTFAGELEDAEALKKAAHPSGKTVEEEIVSNVATIGENLTLRRAASLSVTQGVVGGYVHNAVVPGLGKIGAIAALESSAPADQLAPIAKSLCMHIAAAAPKSLTVEKLSQDLVARERAVIEEQLKAEDKPADIIAKMMEGRLRKFYQEVVLLEQTNMLDGKTKIADLLKNAEKELGAPVKLTGYVRYMVGEGIEKEESDFQAEVAAQAGLSS